MNNITVIPDSSTSQAPTYCPYCSNPPNYLAYHSGACPKVKSIEYYPDGTVKKIEFKDSNLAKELVDYPGSSCP